MLKIQQFVKEQFQIDLTPQQLEMIASIAAGDDNYELRWGRSAGLSTAKKAAIAYLQDGMKEETPRKWWVTNKDAPADNQRVAGPFTTSSDAGVARAIVEKRDDTNTYWLECLDD